ncbi:ST6B1 Sulfotransferase, partial [Mohoua ochrocephala]|nr:ST6B1 Sulfotransferase [Mohoua ochrocephala]
LPFLRILITHLNYDCLPKSIFMEKGKVVVLFRNPKDTAVSFFHFHNNVPSVPSYSSRDEFFSGFMTDLKVTPMCFSSSLQLAGGSCFDPAVTWNEHTEDKNTMVIIYEDLKGLKQMPVKQVAEFFGFSPTAEQIQAIAERDTFQPVSVKAQETHGAVGSILFHKGKFVYWKNVFAEDQNQKLAAKFKVCLEVTKLGVKFKYDVYCKP